MTTEYVCSMLSTLQHLQELFESQAGLFDYGAKKPRTDVHWHGDRPLSRHLGGKVTTLSHPLHFNSTRPHQRPDYLALSYSTRKAGHYRFASSHSSRNRRTSADGG